MAKPPNERITRERLEKATALAKKGQYQKARYLLSDIQSNPRAKKLLKQMEGRNDKLQGGISYFYSGTIVLMVVFGIIALVVFFNVIGNIQGGLQNQGAVNASFDERGLTGNRNLYSDLVFFCYDRVGEESESCIDWGQLVFTDYVNSVRSCVIVDEDGIQYRNRPYEEIETCYQDAGIPEVGTTTIPEETADQ